MYPLRDDHRPGDHQDLSDIDRLIQRIGGALGRLHAEQTLRGLPLSTPHARPDEQYAAAALDANNSELRAAIDAALVAEYPALQRLRERIAAEAYADDDETAPYLSARERARARFARWLIAHGLLSEWRARETENVDEARRDDDG